MKNNNYEIKTRFNKRERDKQIGKEQEQGKDRRPTQGIGNQEKLKEMEEEIVCNRW